MGFGIDRGMLTLFMTVAQGIDWERALMPLFEVSPVAVAGIFDCIFVFLVDSAFTLM